MKPPYIGITGFMERGEVLSVLNSMLPRSNVLVMFGVLASLKTLKGLRNKWPNRYPFMEEIPRIFQKNPSALNLVHYNTSEPETLHEQLRVLTGILGGNLQGFQLNIAWPNPRLIGRYRKIYPAMQIVLQVGSHAFELVGRSPQQLACKVSEYWGLVDYVLLDPSGGQGKPLDLVQARECLDVLTARPMNMGLGVAGGLSPTTLHLIEPLAAIFPNLSIDAEGLLRDSEDHLSLPLAKEYLLKARVIFGR